jgi:chromosome segregation ATPase
VHELEAERNEALTEAEKLRARLRETQLENSSRTDSSASDSAALEQAKRKLKDVVAENETLIGEVDKLRQHNKTLEQQLREQSMENAEQHSALEAAKAKAKLLEQQVFRKLGPRSFAPIVPPSLAPFCRCASDHSRTGGPRGLGATSLPQVHELEAERNEALAEAEKLRARLRETQLENSSIAELSASDSAALEQAKRKLTGVVAENETLIGEVDKLNSRLRDSHHANESLQRQIAEAESELARCQRKLVEMRFSAEEAARDHSDLVAEAEALRRKCRELADALEQEKMSATNARQQGKVLEQQLHEQSEANADLQSALELARAKARLAEQQVYRKPCPCSFAPIVGPIFGGWPWIALTWAGALQGLDATSLATGAAARGGEEGGISRGKPSALTPARGSARIGRHCGGVDCACGRPRAGEEEA